MLLWVALFCLIKVNDVTGRAVNLLFKSLALLDVDSVAVVLVDFGVDNSATILQSQSKLTYEAQWLEHVLHFIELFACECVVNPVDVEVVGLLLLLF